MILDIPESFFEKEVRRDFTIIPMMKRAWACEMEALMQIDRICKMHEIRYFVAYGSLLGTVREHGFIPWDDDIDIWMFREDYNRFLSVAPELLPQSYWISSCYTCLIHNQPISAVMNRKDIGQNEELNREFYGCPFICGIDIFPLDYIPDDKEADEIQLNVMTILFDCAQRFEELKSSGQLEERVSQIEQLLNIKLNRDEKLHQTLWKLEDSVSSMYSEADGNRVAVQHHRFTIGMGIMPASWFSSVTLAEFEMITVPIPSEYDKVLTSAFGDWRTPIKFGAGHGYPFYRKQIAGLPADYPREGLLPEESS